MWQVAPHPLWVGHAGDGTDFRRVFDLGIRAVVQVAAEEPPPQAPAFAHEATYDAGFVGGVVLWAWTWTRRKAPCKGKRGPHPAAPGA